MALHSLVKAFACLVKAGSHRPRAGNGVGGDHDNRAMLCSHVPASEVFPQAPSYCLFSNWHKDSERGSAKFSAFRWSSSGGCKVAATLNQQSTPAVLGNQASPPSPHSYREAALALLTQDKPLSHCPSPRVPLHPHLPLLGRQPLKYHTFHSTPSWAREKCHT